MWKGLVLKEKSEYFCRKQGEMDVKRQLTNDHYIPYAPRELSIVLYVIDCLISD
jgi:hypothetical protein